MMSGTKSRDKGKRGERELVKFLQDLGFPDASRSAQHSGKWLSDVVCLESLPSLHIECKFGYPIGTFDLGKQLWYHAIEQATRDANGKPWVLFWKPLRQIRWRLTCRWYGMLVTFTEHSDMKSVLWAYEEVSHDHSQDVSGGDP